MGDSEGAWGENGGGEKAGVLFGDFAGGDEMWAVGADAGDCALPESNAARRKMANRKRPCIFQVRCRRRINVLLVMFLLGRKGAERERVSATVRGRRVKGV